MSLERATLKSRGCDYCFICNSETVIANSFATRYIICSEKCRCEMDERAKTQRKITRYSKINPDYDVNLGNSRKCKYCDNTLSHSGSLRTMVNICSESCLKIHEESFDERKGGANTIDFWIRNGYSPEEAKEQVSKEQRRRSQRCIECWLERGYSEEESREKVSNFQSINTAYRTDKYTHDELAAMTPLSQKYWIAKGMTEDEAEEQVRFNNSRSLDGYIARHGVEEGTKKYNNFCKINGAAQTLEHYIELNGEEIGTQNWYRKFDKQAHSEIAKKLFNDIMQQLPEDFKERHGTKIYFKGYSEKEFGKRYDNGYYFYDFVISSLKYCIEFNGNMFHANPNLYEADHIIPVINMPARDVWDFDERKINFLKNEYNFIVDVIWESEYNRRSTRLKREEVVKSIVDKIITLDQGETNV